MLYAATGRAITRLVQRVPYLPEYVSLGSGVVTFLLFSFSGFQLPHYLNIVFPFYAVLTAHFLTTLRTEQSRRAWLITQQVLWGVLLALVVGLIWFFRPEPLGGAIAWVVVVVIITVVMTRAVRWLPSLVGWSVGGAVLALGFYNLFLYPNLMPYQAGGEAAFRANQLNQKQLMTGQYGFNSYSFEFYLTRKAHYWRTKAELTEAARQQPLWVISTPLHLDTLRRDGWAVAQLDTFRFFHVTKLTGPFLKYETRAGAAKEIVLAEIRFK